MKYYCIKLLNLPITSIHKASLDQKFIYDEDSKHEAYLNVNGRLCKNIKFAICNSEEEALKLLKYWKPQLDNREYGDYSFIVESGYANKWQQKYLGVNNEKLTELFATSLVCNTPKKPSSKSTFPSSNEGFYLVEVLLTNDDKKYYVSTFKKDGGIKLVSYLSGAGLYKNEKKCLSKIDTLNKKNMRLIRTVPLSKEQYEEIKEEKTRNYY